MANRLNWSKAQPKRKPTDTAQTRKLEYRADRYLDAVESKTSIQRKPGRQKNRKLPL